MTPLDTFIDFQNRRAIVVDGHEDAIMTLTTVQDIAGIVARAVDYDGEWPAIGGMRGNRVTVSQILEIGAKVGGVSPPSHNRKMTCSQRSQVILLPFIRSNWKTLKLEILKHHGHWESATQVLLTTKPTSSQLC